MIFVTGDTHGDFKRIINFCAKYSPTKQDIMIILGDTGINYYDINHPKTKNLKETLSKLNITFFCIHGNHENRASNIATYQEKEYLGGKVYVEREYPNILFAKDGEIFNFEQNNISYPTLVIGGAYSIDKEYRKQYHYHWWPDEQPSPEIKAFTESQINQYKESIKCVLSHTCPLSVEPIEWFISGLEQSKVDNTTEKWLDTIYTNLAKDSLNKWYCGHFHGNKTDGVFEFLYDLIVPFMTSTGISNNN